MDIKPKDDDNSINKLTDFYQSKRENISQKHKKRLYATSPFYERYKKYGKVLLLLLYRERWKIGITMKSLWN